MSYENGNDPSRRLTNDYDEYDDDDYEPIDTSPMPPPGSTGDDNGDDDDDDDGIDNESSPSRKARPPRPPTAQSTQSASQADHGLDPEEHVQFVIAGLERDVELVHDALASLEKETTELKAKRKANLSTMSELADQILDYEEEVATARGVNQRKLTQEMAQLEDKLKQLHTQNTKTEAILKRKDREADANTVITYGLEALRDKLVDELNSILEWYRERDDHGSDSEEDAEADADHVLDVTTAIQRRWREMFFKGSWQVTVSQQPDASQRLIPTAKVVMEGNKGAKGVKRGQASLATGTSFQPASRKERGGPSRVMTGPSHGSSAAARRPLIRGGKGTGPRPGITSGSPAQRLAVAYLNEVDELMGDELQRPIIKKLLASVGLKKIRRVGPGVYLIGGARVEPHLVNGRVMIRVCGGQVALEEYIKRYGVRESENLKTSRDTKSMHYKINKVHEVDEAIEEACMNEALHPVLDAIPPLERVSFHDFSFGNAAVNSGKYKFGTKTVTIHLRNGNLLVAHGGGLVPFDAYVLKYGVAETKKFYVPQ